MIMASPTTLLTDLQRCRRMVAGMRGIVTSSSLRKQLLRELLAATRARDMRVSSSADGQPLTPRSRYQRNAKAQRIRVIQRQWRRYRWHRIIMDKMRMERRWRDRRGKKPFEQSAVTIQRIFRGFLVRNRLYSAGKQRKSLLEIVVNAERQSRASALREQRLAYHKLLTARLGELQKAGDDRRNNAQDMARTQQRIDDSKAKGLAFLYIDAKLLDGTAVRMEATQLLMHQMNEERRVTGLLERLEREVAALQQQAPVIHLAATRIQAAYRSYRCQQRKLLELRRRRQAHMLLIVSRERCYDRMNAGFLARQREQWNRCASVIASLHRIHEAKQLLKTYREQRAARRIAQLHYLRRQRHQAQEQLVWLRTKRRARAWGVQRQRQWLIAVWQNWVTFAREQVARKAAMVARLQHGQREWLVKKAMRLQAFFRRTQQLRATLEKEIVPRLHPVLMQLIDQAERGVSLVGLSNRTKQQEHFQAFYELVEQHMRAWRVPSPQHQSVAQRYGAPLESLPLDRIWRWLQRRSRRDAVQSGWCLDLRSSPHFTVRGLRFLDRLSQYWGLYDRIQWQCARLETQQEAAFVARDYLVQLYRHALVRAAPMGWSGLLAAQREAAVRLLLRANAVETLPSNEFESSTAFMTFHTVPMTL
ncbi:hypothetical protein ATCC90586_007747 [Pythium insidiosum]|nr:hypothetical protein ATCC90586_007747 [Pythium insidiosum]